MKLLLDERKRIIYIGEVVEATTIEELPAWKIGNNYAIDNGYSVVEVVDVPIEVIPSKYFYINEAFTIDPNYIDENKLSLEIAELNNQLSLQMESNIENDFRLCKIELGM